MPTKQAMLKTVVGILLFAAGLIASVYIHRQSAESITFNAIREDLSDYKYIHPFLFLTVSESAAFPLYSDLKESIADYRASAIKNNSIKEVSVYFRDLDTSKWVGVEPQEMFSAASMLKVVILVAAFHKAQSDPHFLETRIRIAPEGEQANDAQDYFPSQNPAKPGDTYTVSELLEKLIVESDNNANSVLTQFIGEEEINNTFDILRIPRPTKGSTNVDTAQDYSHVFRVLYGSTYLSEVFSEKALELLSRTKFDGGIVAGVPTGTTVSHKFGERTLRVTDPVTSATATLSHELHDCGIVYYPGHPYFLCVMTKGDDFGALSNVIRDVSRITWDSVRKLHP